ncbi:KAT8 regulatory NSL complex subunit 1-like [Lineus longissimus]|uniref:KAT8 regulatory NSL complex subunit 1-like n=1 Tax=Lineus longissimus TaxID=88925 RepID=UPI002B4CFF56
MSSDTPPVCNLKDRILTDLNKLSGRLAINVRACMSRPLPLRLCCMAAMAPALTEAATTPRVKLLSPPDTHEKELNGGDHQALVGDCTITRSPVQKIHNLAKTKLVSITQKDFLQNSKFKIHTAEEAKLIAGKQTFGTLKLVHPKTFKDLQDLYQQRDRLFLKSNQNGDLFVTDSMNQDLLNGTATTTSTTATGVPVGKTSIMTMNGKSVAPDKPAILLQQKVPQAHAGSLNTKTTNGGVSNSGEVGDVTKAGCGDSVLESADMPTQMPVDGSGDADILHSPCPQSPQEDNMKDSVSEVTRRQRMQEKRAQRLLRRVRRLQARQSHAHVSDQLTGLVGHQHKSLESMAKSIKVPPTNTDYKTELLQSENIKNLSTASLVNLVRKLQSSQPITLKQRLTSSQSDAASVIRLDEDFCAEIEKTSSQMVSDIRQLETALDSDATESSSGGESCDEMDYEDYSNYRQTPLHRRAEWRWAQERAEVATRWTWLQAQVSDLEYRIRTHSDIHKQLRNSKGSVVLGEPPTIENLLKLSVLRTGGKKLSPIEAKIAKIEKQNEMSPVNLSVLLNNVDHQAQKLTQSLVGNCFSPLQGPGLNKNRTTNGYVDTPVLVNNLDTQDGGCASKDVSDNVDNSCVAARCRPVRSYRKRKLYRTTGLHLASRKASRLSTVRCQCYPPSTPCAMCGGRYNNTVPLDSDTLPPAEKVALLDNSFHSVLSFPQDIPLQIHFESLLKSGDWQNKSLHKQVKQQQAASPLEKRRNNKISPTVDHVRKQSKKLAKTAVSLLSQKYRTKYSDRSRSRCPVSKMTLQEKRQRRQELKRRKIAKKLALAMKKKEKRERRFSLPASYYHKTPCSTANASPRDTPPPSTPGSVSCPASSAMLKEMKELMKKRRGESAFDINNIVIPYSIAAATRVTKIEYKEIITPKWRELSVENAGLESHVNEVTPLPPDVETKETLPSNANGMIIMRKVDEEAEEMEDLTDDEFAMRHLRCEIKEKKRYMTYITKNKRNRGSRTESGAATPDPMGQPEHSPNEPNLVSSFNSGFGTPPSTPIGGVRFEEGRRRSGSISCSYGSKRERDRSLSGDHLDRMFTSTPEFEEVLIPPWEPREFPISEEEYDGMKREMEDVINRVPTPPIVMEESEMLPPMQSEPVTPINSSPPSPLPSTSSGSAGVSMLEEDPNDPEWTVVSPEPRPRNIVLKLAKR